MHALVFRGDYQISIAKEKAGKMPKGSMEALKDEMTHRIGKQ